jgi:hypothetical protein
MSKFLFSPHRVKLSLPSTPTHRVFFIALTLAALCAFQMFGQITELPKPSFVDSAGAQIDPGEADPHSFILYSAADGLTPTSVEDVLVEKGLTPSGVAGHGRPDVRTAGFGDNATVLVGIRVDGVWLENPDKAWPDLSFISMSEIDTITYVKTPTVKYPGGYVDITLKKSGSSIAATLGQNQKFYSGYIAGSFSDNIQASISANAEDYSVERTVQGFALHATLKSRLWGASFSHTENTDKWTNLWDYSAEYKSNTAVFSLPYTTLGYSEVDSKFPVDSWRKFKHASVLVSVPFDFVNLSLDWKHIFDYTVSSKPDDKFKGTSVKLLADGKYEALSYGASFGANIYDIFENKRFLDYGAFVGYDISPGAFSIPLQLSVTQRAPLFPEIWQYDFSSHVYKLTDTKPEQYLSFSIAPRYSFGPAALSLFAQHSVSMNELVTGAGSMNENFNGRVQRTTINPGISASLLGFKGNLSYTLVLLSEDVPSAVTDNFFASLSKSLGRAIIGTSCSFIKANDFSGNPLDDYYSDIGVSMSISNRSVTAQAKVTNLLGNVHGISSGAPVKPRTFTVSVSYGHL